MSSIKPAVFFVIYSSTSSVLRVFVPWSCSPHTSHLAVDIILSEPVVF